MLHVGLFSTHIYLSSCYDLDEKIDTTQSSLYVKNEANAALF